MQTKFGDTLLTSPAIAWPASACAAQQERPDEVLLDEHEFYSPQLTALDDACRLEARTLTANDIDGLNAIEFSAPSHRESVLRGGVMLNYTAIIAKSEFGGAEGTIICVAPPPQNLIAEVAFDFEGRGFAGFEDSSRSRNSPRSENHRSLLSLQSLAPIKGAN